MSSLRGWLWILLRRRVQDPFTQNISKEVIDCKKKCFTHTVMITIFVGWGQILPNSFAFVDGIWRLGTWSILVHKVACCLTAPSLYLNQWGTTAVVLRAIWRPMFTSSIPEMCLETEHLTLQPPHMWTLVPSPRTNGGKITKNNFKCNFMHKNWLILIFLIEVCLLGCDW